MKYLISFNTNIVRQEQSSEWEVGKILTLGSDLSENLSNLPMDNQSVFYIPTVSDYNNSLSYGGANLALRILMKYLISGITSIDVVLMGNESESNFLLHYDYPNILKIPGLHYIRFNKKVVATYEIPQREQLKAKQYKPYLDNLGLKIPSSFKSTHSLTNEWCLFKWNSFMGFNESTSFLEGHLYFEYLITIEKICSVKNKTVSDDLKKRISNYPSSRILVVDDKVGWHSFFKEMFSNTDKVDVHCIGENFNKLGFADIEKCIADAVNNFKPHVIILDFRLMEDKDAEEKDNMKQISGYRVLSEILKGDYKNPLDSFGRQVIIFTATSRIENILLLKAGNADGFILKEKPENYQGKEITKNVISKMVYTLNTAIDRAVFLIPLNEKIRELNTIKLDTKPELRDSIQTVSESVRLITQNNDINEGVLKLTYLNLFSILEYMKPSNIKHINEYIQPTAPNEILKDWNNIDSVRNSLAHGDKEVKIDNRKKALSLDLIKDWTLNLCDFIEAYINHNICKING